MLVRVIDAAAIRAVRRGVGEVGLAERQQVKDAFAESGSAGRIEDWIGAGLLQKLKVTSSQSSVIQLTYSAGDPEFATRVANAFAKAYMDTTLDLRVGPTKQATVWFDDQLKTLRRDLEIAQERLAAFQKEKGIIVTDERLDVENTRLAELTTQALQAQNATYESQSRSGLAAGSKARENLPEVLGNPVVQAIKAELMRAEAALTETATRLGPNHPEYRQRASQVANLRGRLDRKSTRLNSSHLVISYAVFCLKNKIQTSV